MFSASPDDPPSLAFFFLGSPPSGAEARAVRPSRVDQTSLYESETPVWVGHSCPTSLTFVISKN